MAEFSWGGITGAAAALVAAQLFSIGFNFDTATSPTVPAVPASGALRLNHATPGSATAVYLSETDARGAARGTELTEWDDTATTQPAVITIRDAVDPTHYASYWVTAATVDSGAYDRLTVTYRAGAGGGFAAGTAIEVRFTPPSKVDVGYVSKVYGAAAALADWTDVQHTTGTGDLVEAVTTDGTVKWSQTDSTPETRLRGYSKAVSGDFSVSIYRKATGPSALQFGVLSALGVWNGVGVLAANNGLARQLWASVSAFTSSTNVSTDQQEIDAPWIQVARVADTVTWSIAWGEPSDDPDNLVWDPVTTRSVGVAGDMLDVASVAILGSAFGGTLFASVLAIDFNA